MDDSQYGTLTSQIYGYIEILHSYWLRMCHKIMWFSMKPPLVVKKASYCLLLLLGNCINTIVVNICCWDQSQKADCSVKPTAFPCFTSLGVWNQLTKEPKDCELKNFIYFTELMMSVYRDEWDLKFRITVFVWISRISRFAMYTLVL